MTVTQRRIADQGGAITSYPIGPYHVKTLAEVVADFIMRYGGEWRCAPMEPLVAPGSTQVNFGRTAVGDDFKLHPAGRPRIAGLIGSNTFIGNANQNNNHLVFEYGVTRSNVASYTFTVDRQQVANRVYVPRVGFPEPGRVGTTAHAIAEDAASKTAMGMRYDAWVDPAEIELAAQRQQLADYQRNLRAGPRRIVTFTPAVNNELQPWVDYQVGDYIRFRAFERDVLRLDVIVRIYGISATIDNNGNEAVSVQTAQEDAP